MKKHIYLLTLILWACSTEPPIANFEMDKSKAYIGESIKFLNKSTESEGYLWDFGDNSTSEEKNPFHSYQSGGFKTVVLTCNNKGGDDVFISKIKIHEGTASYQVKNATSTTLTLSSYYWNGDRSEDFINHGIISTGGFSDTIFTKRNTISLGGILYGQIFIVTDDYPISLHNHNILEINGKTQIYSGKSAVVGANFKSSDIRLENFRLQLQ
jgi:PKD repeat protein